MKKKTRSDKLSIQRATVRVLTDSQLDSANGGTYVYYQPIMTDPYRVVLTGTSRSYSF